MTRVLCLPAAVLRLPLLEGRVAEAVITALIPVFEAASRPPQDPEDLLCAEP